MQHQQVLVHLFVQLPEEHICVSAWVIKYSLTGLPRKPHAGHHMEAASPAESDSSVLIVDIGTQA